MAVRSRQHQASHRCHRWCLLGRRLRGGDELPLPRGQHSLRSGPVGGKLVPLARCEWHTAPAASHRGGAGHRLHVHGRTRASTQGGRQRSSNGCNQTWPLPRSAPTSARGGRAHSQRRRPHLQPGRPSASSARRLGRARWPRRPSSPARPRLPIVPSRAAWPSKARSS